MSGRKMLDLSGKTFGRLTVIRLSSYRDSTGSMWWMCLCSCGAELKVRSGQLVSGKTKSCGCICRERPNPTTHGMRHSPEYRIWSHIKTRCLNPRAPGYRRYGSKGVTICERWLSFENFFADMGPRPTWAKSIDRFPNNRGNYEPGNCRWANDEQQANNKTNNRVVEYGDERLTVAQWSRRLGIGQTGLYKRFKRGLLPHEILRLPAYEASK